MAPEQMEGSHGVDHRADIYSLNGRMGPSKLVTGVRDCVADVLHDRTGLLNWRWLYVGPCGRVEL